MDKNYMGGPQPILAIIGQDSSEEIRHYCRNGHWNMGDNTHNLDLINIPERREGWISVYPHSVGNLHETKEQADRMAVGAQRLACIHISFTEGEGL